MIESEQTPDLGIFGCTILNDFTSTPVAHFPQWS
jgi:hypothetical protein